MPNQPDTPAMATEHRAYTHPDIFERGVAEGWADPVTDPALIDWEPRLRAAAIPFNLVGGRPVNPREQTGIRYGRNELGHWGEQLCADAIVTATTPSGQRRLLMVERDDGHGWAVPGGHVDPGENPTTAALRELAEETGLTPDPTQVRIQTMPARYVPDPRASDEAWMVTVPTTIDLGTLPDADLPAVTGTDDALRAAWIPATTYATAATYLRAAHHGHIFPAHQPMLRGLLN